MKDREEGREEGERENGGEGEETRERKGKGPWGAELEFEPSSLWDSNPAPSGIRTQLPLGFEPSSVWDSDSNPFEPSSRPGRGTLRRAGAPRGADGEPLWRTEAWFRQG